MRDNRRVRSGPLSRNEHGYYAGYLSLHVNGVPQWVALLVTLGPSAGLWRFDL